MVQISFNTLKLFARTSTFVLKDAIWSACYWAGWKWKGMIPVGNFVKF